MPFCPCHRCVEKVLIPTGTMSLCNTQGCSAEISACFRKGTILSWGTGLLKFFLGTTEVSTLGGKHCHPDSLSCHPAAACPAPSMSQHRVSCRGKIRGITPVINSLFICQFNVNLGQLPVELGQEQDEAIGVGRAAWLSCSELKYSWYYSLSLESRMTQQNILNWFLDLCIYSGIVHTLLKKPRKTQQTVSKHKLSHQILEGYWW